MSPQVLYTLEVILNGLMTGVMYSLVALGFVLTVFTIVLVPVVRDAFGWGWAFAMLAPGPVLGVWAMRSLRPDPYPI